MARALTTALVLVVLIAAAHGASNYRALAEAVVAEMTQTEKLSFVHGWAIASYVGNVPMLARLGIPQLNLEDGPQGVADGVLNVTCWPSALTVVASWDVE